MNITVNSSMWTRAVSRIGILNNDSLSMPEDSVDILQSELLPSLIYVSCLLPIGVTGNALACCVYYKKWRKKRKVSTLFILTLALTDLINCLATMPFEIALLLNPLYFDFPILCKISRWMTYFLNCFSTLTLLGIAFDRLFGIRYTFKKAPFGIKRCKIYLACSLLIAMLTTWPALILFGTSTMVHHDTPSKTCLIDDEYASNKMAIKPFWHGIYLIVSIFVVDSILIIIYSLIGCTIYKRRIGPSGLRRSGRFASSFSFKRCSIDSCSCNSKNNFNCPSCRQKAKCALTDIDEILEDDVFVNTATGPHTKSNSSSTEFFSNSCSSNNGRSSRYSGRFSPKRTSPVKSQQSFRFSTGSPEKPLRFSSIKSSLSSQSSRRNLRFESFSNESLRFGPRSRTRKTLLMLGVVTAVYILTFLPYCVIVILRYTSPGLYLTMNLVQKNLYQLFIRSYMLSMSTNSIIYSFVNNHFRQECYLVIKSLFYMYRKNHD
ncbi:putative tyramine receptor 2 [Saccostrea echinata]|uniref:putative tyramine receptor 2 n=1 Tax=Saccostrea echinata TaxID=191078 RepID=UPI002A7FF48B|nr:putative tyramine receptor 2 [Saccostrea echinata]